MLCLCEGGMKAYGFLKHILFANLWGITLINWSWQNGEMQWIPVICFRDSSIQDFNPEAQFYSQASIKAGISLWNKSLL